MGLSKLRLFPNLTLNFVDSQTVLVLVLIVAVIFGAGRLPKLARSLREARDEFNKGESESSSPQPPAAQPPAAQPPAQAPTPPAAPPVENPPPNE
jgi:Sec-independent protein translocase protein TatA